MRLSMFIVKCKTITDCDLKICMCLFEMNTFIRACKLIHFLLRNSTI